MMSDIERMFGIIIKTFLYAIIPLLLVLLLCIVWKTQPFGFSISFSVFVLLLLLLCIVIYKEDFYE